MSKLNTRERVQLFCSEPSLTKQSFKDECDINNIVNLFTQTGQMPTVNTMAEQYGDSPNITLKTALDLVKNLNQEFDNLSPEIQAGFNDNPREYAQFLSDYEEMPDSFIQQLEAQDDTLASQTQTSTDKTVVTEPTKEA